MDVDLAELQMGRKRKKQKERKNTVMELGKGGKC